MSVWTNPQESYADRYTVSIFGSLRDHYAKDVEALLAWFDQKCALEQLDLRQATLTIQNDEVGTVTMRYLLNIMISFHNNRVFNKSNRTPCL